MTVEQAGDLAVLGFTVEEASELTPEEIDLLLGGGPVLSPGELAAIGLTAEEAAELTPEEIDLLLGEVDTEDDLSDSGDSELSSRELAALGLTAEEADALSPEAIEELLAGIDDESTVAPDDQDDASEQGDASEGETEVDDVALLAVLDFFGFDTAAEVTDLTGLTIQEAADTPVGSLNEIFTAEFGPDDTGEFLGFPQFVLDSTGLTNEEIAELTPVEFFEVIDEALADA